MVLGVGSTVVGSGDGLEVEQFTPVQLVVFTSVKVEFVVFIFIELDGNSDDTGFEVKVCVVGGLAVTFPVKVLKVEFVVFIIIELGFEVKFCVVGGLVVTLPVIGGSVTVIAFRNRLFLQLLQSVARGPRHKSHCG